MDHISAITHTFTTSLELKLNTQRSWHINTLCDSARKTFQSGQPKFKFVVLWVGNRRIDTPVFDKRHKIWGDRVTWIINLRLPSQSTTGVNTRGGITQSEFNVAGSLIQNSTRDVLLQVGNRRINTPVPDKRHKIWSDAVTLIINLRLPTCSTSSILNWTHVAGSLNQNSTGRDHSIRIHLPKRAQN